MSDSSASGEKCIRCQQPLPQDVSFCVSCGFENNSAMLAGREMQIDSKLQQRREGNAMLRKLFAPFGMFRR